MVFRSHGLRPFNAMVVDDDFVHLCTLEKILCSFVGRYQISKFMSPADALCALRAKNNKYDILLCGVPLSDPHAFNLVRFAELEFDIAVVVMISNSSDEAAFEGILIGASQCVAKPITNPEILKEIWQHVVRKRRNEFTINLLSIAEPSCSNNPIVEEGGGIISDQDVSKKPRFVWNDEYQNIFLQAVASIKPPERVVPTKVLEYMKSKGVPNITRENVASHLQKHRMLLERCRNNNVVIHQPSTSVDENKEPSSSYQDHQTLALQKLGSSSSPQNLTIQEQQLIPPPNQPNENAAIIPTDQNNNSDIDWNYLIQHSPLDQQQQNKISSSTLLDKIHDGNNSNYNSESLNFNYEEDYKFHSSYDFYNMPNWIEFQPASHIQKDELKE